MDAGNGSRADMIDQVAEDDAVQERGPQVLVQADLESHLDALWWGQKDAVFSNDPAHHPAPVCSGLCQLDSCECPL